MTEPAGEIAVWARANAACFELVPLVEMHEGKKTHVGYTLELEPEVRLSAQVYHAHDYFAPVTEEERARLASVERKLTALGLKRGHW